MADERLRKREHVKNWLLKHSEIPNWVSVGIGALMLILVAIQTYQGSVMISDRAEQQRPRFSLRLHLEKIDDPVGFRIVAPLEIGGTTAARRVTFKNYVTSDQPRQSDYISSIELDWENREGHVVGDVSPTEEGRRFDTALLSRKQLETIVSTEESLYFIARLEYCDIQDNCYYFMRCAELGDTGFVGVLTYCGTRLGHLMRD